MDAPSDAASCASHLQLPRLCTPCRATRQLVLVSVLWAKCTPRQHFAACRLQSGLLKPRRFDIGLCRTPGYPQPTETGAGTGLDKASGPSPAPLDRLSNSERARHKNVSWFLMAAERVESIAVHSLFIAFTCSIVLFQYLEVLILMCTFTHTVYSVTQQQMTSPHHLSSSALVVLVQVVHGRGLDLRGVDDDVRFTRQIV